MPTIVHKGDLIDPLKVWNHISKIQQRLRKDGDLLNIFHLLISRSVSFVRVISIACFELSNVWIACGGIFCVFRVTIFQKCWIGYLPLIFNFAHSAHTMFWYYKMYYLRYNYHSEGELLIISFLFPRKQFNLSHCLWYSHEYDSNELKSLTYLFPQ